MLQLFIFFPYLLLLLFSTFLIESNGQNNETLEPCSTVTYCGNQQVRYPFWLKSNATDYDLTHCGYQGFGLDCSFQDGALSLQLENEKFRVQNISYNDCRVTLVDPQVQNNPECPAPSQSLIILEDLPLAYNRADFNLTFYFNCNTTLPFRELNRNWIDCLSSGGNASYVFDDTYNPEDFYLSGICEEKVVVAAVIDPKPEQGKTILDYWKRAMNSGFVLDWRADIKCSSCETFGGRCGFKDGDKGEEFLCFCNNSTTTSPDRCLKVQPAGEKFNTPRKFAVGFGVVAFILLFSVLFLLKIKRNVCNRLLLLRRNTKEDVNLEAFLKQFGSLAPKRCSYSDIKRMTMSFKDKLGQGGYGTVYKGKLLDGRLVAVKILKASQGDGEEFINEVLSICRTSHINVVTFLGFCLEGKKRALVYEFMPNGSLEKFIHDEKNLMGYNQLGMDKLHQISLGVARGLDYLHQGCNTRILHFDIKPHNILLDKDFCPKISDFGLAKQCTKENSTVTILDIRGTIGYMAPELVSRHFGGVSYKSDVYSYGMMILEIVGRRKNVISDTSHSSEVYFPHWAYQHLIVRDDLRLKGVLTPEDDEIARKIILVGLWCIQNDPLLRPTMSKVIEMLEGHLQAIPIPPKAFFGSPSITPQPSFSSSCTSLVVSS